ncbi:MAG: PAS domain S-box protein [Acidobacteria bacterium]|nr:PAS domain S-box protein [Acidobacteriota bacterium]
MVVGGVAAVAAALLDVARDGISHYWLILALLTLVSGSFAVKVPAVSANISVSDAFVLLLVLLYGPAPATLTVALDGLFVSWYRGYRTPQRVLFNFAEPAVSVWVTSHTYYLLSGAAPLSVQPTELTGLLLPMLACSVVYFILNSGFTALAVAADTGMPFHRIWRGHFMWLGLNYFGSASIAMLLAAATREISIVTLAAVVPLLVISYLTFKNSMARVEDAKRHVTEMTDIASSRVEERRQATEALRQSEEQYRRLFEESRDAIYMTAPGGPILDVNHALLKLFGATREELVGTSAELAGTSAIESWMRKEDRDRFRATLERDGLVRDFEAAFRKNDQTIINCLVTATAWRGPEGTVQASQGIIRDVTEQRRLEEQLRQSQKMEAIGRLAGGVAHDFNNLLTVIFGYVDVLQGQLANTPAADGLAEVRQAAERASLLTQQLLAFSRRQRLEPKLLDVNWAVANADRMLRRVLGEDIRLRTALAPGVLTVLADPGQLEQVLMNIVVNARDAMPAGGTLTIETYLADVSGPAGMTLTIGSYAVLSITDTGTGMSAETQSRLFEPFFSTKGVRGTGLGLATVYGIVRQSGGDIRVTSELGHGTTFTIYLPIAVGTAQQETTKAEPTLSGTEHVLVVEDEPAVRRLVVLTLNRYGYRVSEAGDGEQALGMVNDADVLLTDVVMPGLDGGTLSERVKAMRPDIKIVFMSGYADHALLGDKVRSLNGPFVHKPFTPVGLVTKLREALDGSDAAA